MALKEPLVFNEGVYSRGVGAGQRDVVGNYKLLDKAENNMVRNTELVITTNNLTIVT